jgi:HSP20 family protein
MLAKWNPFSTNTHDGIARSGGQMPVFDDLFREADRLFESAFSTPAIAYGLPAADIYETQDELTLRMDLPGHDPKNIDIQVEGDTLTVRSQRDEGQVKGAKWFRSERAQGQFARSFVLPSTVDASKCDASFQHGVLTLTLPKREEAKPRSISVKVNS